MPQQFPSSNTSYHSVKLMPPPNDGRKLPLLNVEGLGDLAINKIALKYDNKGGQPFFAHNPEFQKIVFYVAEGKIRVDMHGTTIMNVSHTYAKEEGQLRPVGAAADTLPSSDLHSLINIEKNSKASFQEALNRLYTDYSLLRKEETAIKVHRKDVANEIVKDPVEVVGPTCIIKISVPKILIIHDQQCCHPCSAALIRHEACVAELKNPEYLLQSISDTFPRTRWSTSPCTTSLANGPGRSRQRSKRTRPIPI